MAYIELNVLNNAEDRAILGIDLGTTYSLAAILRDGRPTVLRADPDRDDARVPSAIHFPESGEPLVGWAARVRAIEAPGRTIFSVKRFMGRGLAEARSDLESVPFAASETAHGVIQFDAGGKKHTPQELSAMILREVWASASRALGAPAPRRAVITVPAYFDDTQRQATRDAAHLAGLEIMRIVNEPTAASLAYGLDQKQTGTIAVYDLGGGTFDISILTIEEGVFRVLATSGDTHLGGDDLDRALAALALEEIRKRSRATPVDDPAFLQALRMAAEACKIQLSIAPEAELHFVLPESSVSYRRRVTRAEFERLAEPLVQRTLECSARALADAKLHKGALDEVVLVGGSTRIPLVRAAVERFFGRTPHTELNPDEVVALGAAVQGHVLAGGTREILLLDVTPLSLGLETVGGAVSKVILRNSPVPCQATETYTTYADDQTGIDFNVVQGERELAADCRSLGRFQLKGIPPMPAGLARVAVRFALDADGILGVTAKEESTGTMASIDVQPMNGLSDAEVERMLQESIVRAREDFDLSRSANLKVELGTMLRAIEKHLPAGAPSLDRESREDLDRAVERARAALALVDVKAIQSARDELEQASLPLAAVLMDSVAKQALTGKRLSEV